MMFGRIAYEAYALFTGGKTFDGRDMPLWEHLTDRIRGAWGAAAAAARELADVEEVATDTAPTGTSTVRAWFGLTYSNYLVMPRALLQSMPEDWQARFTALLREGDAIVARAGVRTPVYSVRAVDEVSGRFIKDPIPHYRHAPNLLQTSAQADR